MYLLTHDVAALEATDGRRQGERSGLQSSVAQGCQGCLQGLPRGQTRLYVSTAEWVVDWLLGNNMEK